MKYEVTPAALQGDSWGTVSIADTKVPSISLSPSGKAEQPWLSKRGRQEEQNLAFLND